MHIRPNNRSCDELRTVEKSGNLSNMHIAFDYIPVLSNFSLPIKRFNFDGSSMFLVTDQGSLLKYFIESDSSNKYNVELQISIKNFVKKQITHSQVMSVLDLFLYISGSTLYLHSLKDLRLLKSIKYNKHVDLFATNYNLVLYKKHYEHCVQSFKLVLTKQRKLLFYTFEGPDMLKMVNQLHMNETPLAIEWVTDKIICVGTRKEYFMIWCDSGKVVEMFSTIKPQAPNIYIIYVTNRSDRIPTFLPKSIRNKLNINNNGTYGSFLTDNGNTSKNSCHSITPFTSVILAKEHDLTRFYYVDNNSSPKLISTIRWSSTVCYTVYKFPYVLALTVSNVLQIAYVGLSGYYEILQNISFDKYITSNGYHSNTSITIHSIPNFDVITSKNDGSSSNERWFERELDIFITCDNHVWNLVTFSAQTQIRQLNSCNNYKVASILVKCLDDNNPVKPSLQLSTNRIYGMGLFVKRKYKEAMEIFLETNYDPLEVIGMFPLVAKFIQIPIINTISNSTDAITDDDLYLSGNELEQSLNALIYYLTEIRIRIIKKRSKFVNEDIAENVDTSLVFCYSQVNMGMISPLLRLKDNNCNVELTEKLLIDLHKNDELILLYKHNNLHSKAINLYKTRYDNSFSLSLVCNYLKTLGPSFVDIILTESKYIFEYSTMLGISIFIDEYEEVEKLPRKIVLNYLQQYNCQDIIEIYLEHIINMWNENDQFFIDELLITYIDILKKIITLCENNGKNQINNTLCQVLDINNVIVANDRDNIHQIKYYRYKLLKSLINSQRYNYRKIITYLTSCNLLQEKAIVYGKMGNVVDALIVYLYHLQHSALAVEFCNQFFDDNCQTNNSVNPIDAFYHFVCLCVCDDLKLLNMESLDTPISVKKHNFELGVEYFGKILPKLSSTQIHNILALFPGNVQLTSTNRVLRKLIHVTDYQYFKSSIENSLLNTKVKNLDTEHKSMESQKCVVTDNDLCQRCGRKIGLSSFSCTTNGMFIHLYCYKETTC